MKKSNKINKYTLEVSRCLRVERGLKIEIEPQKIRTQEFQLKVQVLEEDLDDLKIKLRTSGAHLSRLQSEKEDRSVKKR